MVREGLKSLCDKCAKETGRSLVVIVPSEECPRCKTNATVRLASATWLFYIMAMAIAVLLMYQWSLGALGLSNEQCTFSWLLLFIILFWLMTSSFGKYVARKMGLIENGGE